MVRAPNGALPQHMSSKQLSGFFFLACMKGFTMSVVQTCVLHAYDGLARYSTINPTLPSHLSGFPDCSLVVCMPNGLFSVMFLLDVFQFAWYCVCVCLLSFTSHLMVLVKAANGKPEDWDKEPSCK